MNSPLVTIVTPTHNHEKFITKCIKSVINQSFENWEIIIIDDHSEDETYTIVKKFARKESRIRVVRHTKNWGVKKLVDTYNQALKMAKGKYLAILEGDDFWPKDKLSLQIANFQKHKKALMSFGNCIYTNESGIPIKLHSYEQSLRLLNNKPTGAIINLFCDLSFSIIPVTVIMKTQAVKSVGGFLKDKYYPFADIPIFLKLALKGEFTYQNDVLGYYRKQSTSEWFNYASQTSAMGREELKDSLKHFLRKNNKNAEIKKIVKKRILQKQDVYILKRKNKKRLSLILNSMAFKLPVSPLTLIFLAQYAHWKYKSK